VFFEQVGSVAQLGGGPLRRVHLDRRGALHSMQLCAQPIGTSLGNRSLSLAVVENGQRDSERPLHDVVGFLPRVLCPYGDVRHLLRASRVSFGLRLANVRGQCAKVGALAGGRGSGTAELAQDA